MIDFNSLYNARSTRLINLPYTDVATALDFEDVTQFNENFTAGRTFRCIVFDRKKGSASDAKKAGRYEIIDCVSETTGTVTVVRGLEDTVGMAFDTAGIWEVILAPTADVIKDLKGLVDEKADLAGGSGANFTAMPQVSTAPIVAKGSNADGYWIKFADGSMICFGTHNYTLGIDNVTGSIFFGNAVTFNFPQTFLNVRSMTFTGMTAFETWGGTVQSVTTTTFNIIPLASVSKAASTYTFHWIAIGTWS